MITLILCSNASGNLKTKLMVIGIYKKSTIVSSLQEPEECIHELFIGQ